MGRKPNLYNQIIVLLQELHHLYPSHNMGRHLEGALGEYRDIWGISDKELFFALTKYRAQLEYDYPTPLTEDKELERIIEEGKNLDIHSILENEEDY